MKVYEIEITYTFTKCVSVVAPNEEIAKQLAIMENNPEFDEVDNECEVTDEYEIKDASDIPDDALQVTCKLCNNAVKGICECPKHLYKIPISRMATICDNFK